jgi:preprotein translocase subunit SecF
MQFIKPDVNINFIGVRRFAYIFSLAMLVISLGSLILKGGPRYGIDFAGGTVIQVRFTSTVSLGAIKSALAETGISGASVQSFGDRSQHEYLVRTDPLEEMGQGYMDNLTQNLARATGSEAEIRRVEMVGPQVGKDLREKALFAIFYALLFITVYISGRFEYKWTLSIIMAAALAGALYLFRSAISFMNFMDLGVPVLIVAALIVTLILFWFLELKYAMGAIAALIHDVTITVGIFSIADKEFTLPIIAALLTIIGYSLNDTIIVFDRIRENQRKLLKKPMAFILNRSVNETLSRTILTSGTTMVVLIALFILGGGIIHDFAFALIIGVLVGTYSSIYVAAPILLIWQARAPKPAKAR